jgi:hypothetical protein
MIVHVSLIRTTSFIRYFFSALYNKQPWNQNNLSLYYIWVFYDSEHNDITVYRVVTPCSLADDYLSLHFFQCGIQISSLAHQCRNRCTVPKLNSSHAVGLDALYGREYTQGEKVVAVRAMKTYRGSRDIAHSFLTSAIDGGECSTSGPGRFNPR